MAEDNGRSATREGKPASTRLFLAVITPAVFVSVLMASMINVLIPLIRAEFGASAAQVGWVITGYALTYAIGIPLYGRASDFFGVRRVFSVGVLGFAAGGLICALAPSLTVLVLGRVVQGIGGAALPAAAFAAVAKVLPAGERGTAFGIIASSVGIGTAVGPVVGGAVGGLAGWRLLFYVSLVMMVLIPFALRVLPGGGSEEEQRFDLTGGILLGAGAGLFLFGITQGQVAGFAFVSSWGSFLGAALAAAGFVWRINGVSHPFVSPALFKNRAYVAAVIVGFCAQLVNVSVLVLVPLLVVEVNGFSPGAAGLVLTPGAVALAILSPLTGRISDRIGVRAPILAGLSLMALSTLFISTFAAGASALLVAAGVLGAGAGFAFIVSPANNAAANALPGEEAGAGLGIFQGTFFLGAGTGSALIGALLAAQREGGSGALNPFYALDAAPFSDAFLAMAVAVIIAVVAALGLRGGVKGDGENERTPTGGAP